MFVIMGTGICLKEVISILFNFMLSSNMLYGFVMQH